MFRNHKTFWIAAGASLILAIAIVTGAIVTTQVAQAASGLGFNVFQRGKAYALFFGQVLQFAAFDREHAVGVVFQNRAAVHPLKQPHAFQSVQVFTDGFWGHGEFFA